MLLHVLRRLAFVLVLAGIGTAATAQTPGIIVRVTPPNQAQFLQYQRFDLRVEATGADSGAVIESLVVSLDGRDITSSGSIEVRSGGARNWVLRDCYLGIPGTRLLSATAAGKRGVVPIIGRSQSIVEVRFWTESPAGPANAKQQDRAVDLDRVARMGPVANGPQDLGESAADPTFRAEDPAAPSRTTQADPVQRRARNVILLIGDGMGVAHRTAARVLSRGYAGGKAKGTLAMDRFPFNGLLMTSSLDTLVTDSAPGAHVYSTGNKTNNGMEGVFPDNTAAEDDNPRIENLPEWITRNFGMVTGIVSDAHLTDATPAAMLAHTQNRGNGTLIASQFFDLAPKNNLKVLMGGGTTHFIPKSRPGSQRTDERNVVQDFTKAGFRLVENRSQLRSLSPGPGSKVIGLFALGGMNVAFDKLRLGDRNIVDSNPDQPFLDEMAAAAIDVLSQYPEGFFLMVEGAHIDKQAHGMDAERSIYDVIQFDKAVGVALEFATRTNSDSDPANDTLVVVGADHETGGLALPGVSRPEAKGGRDFLKTYGYGAARNDSTRFNFTNYADANRDGYPDDPDPDYKLMVSFGANSDRYEDWQSNARPKSPTRKVGTLYVANPDDPDRYALGSFLVTGVLENGDHGGGAGSAVHTMTDVPVSAFGPGASQFARIADNTEAFFNIVNAIVGRYPTPQY